MNPAGALAGAVVDDPATRDVLDNPALLVPGAAQHSKERQFLKIKTPVFRSVRFGSSGLPLEMGFHDLVGNVAEFVCEDAVSAAALPNACEVS